MHHRQLQEKDLQDVEQFLSEVHILYLIILSFSKYIFNFLIYYLDVFLKLGTSVGLPENMTETIIQEIFERCGEITTLRLSKKNFCHIRFVLEASVDAAIYLSGYRVRIGSNGDSANTGRLHVDFAQVR